MRHVGEPTTLTRVLLADGSETFRLGLRSKLLSDNRHVEVAEAGSGSTAVSLATTFPYDVAIVDLHLPDQSGVEVCGKIREANPRTSVLMTSVLDHDIDLAMAHLAGAAAYVSKQEPLADIVRAVYQAASGRYFTVEQIKRVEALHDDIGANIESITPRQRDVLYLVTAGYSNRQIAEALSLSESTVEKHIGELLKKLALRSRAEMPAMILHYHADLESFRIYIDLLHENGGFPP